MKQSRTILAVISVFGISACESSPIGSARQSSANMSARTAGAFEMNLGALKNAALPKGQCGMILWTLDADTPTAILRYLAGGDAEVVLDQNKTNFSLDHANGASGFGVYEEQEFQNDAGIRMSVRVRFGLGFDGGSYLERGIVTLESPDGWRSVTPAAGIAGCRAK